MIVAGDATTSAYGSSEKQPVRSPLMVLASLPRKISPSESERFQLPFCNGKNIKKCNGSD
jgi:hypothetical protein